MEEEVGRLSRGKKRKAIPDPNKKFMTLADALVAGETISEPNQAIQEAGAGEDVIKVEGMEEEESSNSEAEELLAVRTHTGLTMSSIGVPFCFPDDVLPPEGTYSSREQVREAINDWARPRGYAFSISKSRTYANGKRECVFSCDRGAGRTPSLSGSRETSTRRTGCLFSVLAKEDRITGNWLLKHRQGTQFHTHNHEPSLDPTAHPSHRQLSREDQLKVQNLSNAGIVPKKIRSYPVIGMVWSGLVWGSRPDQTGANRFTGTRDSINFTSGLARTKSE
ncbi:hypothetical protein FOVG_17406 [Fusarium oxysporum f. sp. pisi HDV247]|uniref:FAR1 domain-containing protein n=1 Tax=Fusarium oxysporum f. sp. pisi HDV247 TaxID=1080344 RepID=W9NMQ9_FUSOX|nr:hypothetical protein FOVG_17406 [Fusarium oxysporum f. sp. pisi HDV247]